MIKEKQQLGFYESNFVNILPYCRITKNGGQEVTWNVINQSNMLEMMRVNIKVRKKKKKKEKTRKGFYERSENIAAKNNSTPNNSTPALSSTSPLKNTTKIIVAEQLHKRLMAIKLHQFLG